MWQEPTTQLHDAQAQRKNLSVWQAEAEPRFAAWASSAISMLQQGGHIFRVQDLGSICYSNIAQAMFVPVSALQ